MQKSFNRFGQQEEMGTQTPKAAGSKTSSYLATSDHDHSAYPPASMAVDGPVEIGSSTCYAPLASRGASLSEERQTTTLRQSVECSEEADTSQYHPHRQSPASSLRYPDIPEELAQILVKTMVDGRRGEELAEAFQQSSALPPITTQSLSELDIQSIITNIKLRHDVNFDRDLSFRPNLDGARGQEKTKSTERYWNALIAELELYARLFHNTPFLQGIQSPRRDAFVHHAKRRIPKMFQTVQEVLKSLVPDRDHSRVDEHLDVPMLMQEIERGVCDLVRLAEWMAQLLKEHCAPMRDVWVDEMVAAIKEGAVLNKSERIVGGLRKLLGILETMKLDVANHQIRNLKNLLIEDTINFEKHYHLERLVGQRSRVNIDVAQAWFRRASWDFTGQPLSQHKTVAAFQLEVFTHAVLAQLFNNCNGRHELPETFYLDQDRLRTLEAEIQDLVHVEVCIDVFAVFVRELGGEREISSTTRQQVYSSLKAIMGEAMGYGASRWHANSEALSLELLRQASLVSGQTLTYDYDTLATANKHLLRAFHKSSTTHSPRLQITLLHRVITCNDRYINSTPTELFNNLIPTGQTPTTLSTNFSHLCTIDGSASNPISNAETAKRQDIANRISHIILLHWRVWGEIAYLPQQDSPSTDNPDAPSSPSALSVRSPTDLAGQDAHVLPSMQTGEPPEGGADAHVAREMSSR